MMSGKPYDFVVVGAGSAGCILAARLAQAKIGTVLLLEAGQPATHHPEVLSADGFKHAFANDALMHHRMTVAQAGVGQRRLYVGTGRVMGGSGSVNGMVYTRGDHRDYDHWPKGWHWEDVQPAFAAIEAVIGVRPRHATVFAQSFIKAACEAGFRRKDGLNDGELGGFVGCNDMNYAGDERRSSYRAWLHENAEVNLDILTRATAERLVFNEDRQAIAVEYRSQGQLRTVEVRREVILCAGALETPRLLMLSGVGPPEQLQAVGIPLVQASAGIGQHLQDHPNVCLFYQARQKVDFNYPQVYGFDAARRTPYENTMPQPDSCYVCYAAPASLKQSMLRMLPVLALPGLLYRIAPLRHLLRGLVHLAFALPPVRHFVGRLFGIVVILGKPVSRGQVRLASSSPAVAADINPAYYSDPRDRDTMLTAVGKARLIAQQPALAGARPLSEGAKTFCKQRLWNWVTAATMTTFHFAGSCRMGDDDASPVDTRLRVKGLRNVRVADASVMPEIPVSALNAPSMMIGYRAADFILAGEPT
jgi:choline dehydrogenase